MVDATPGPDSVKQTGQEVLEHVFGDTILGRSIEQWVLTEFKGQDLRGA